MDDLETTIRELISDAETRHRNNANEYYSALKIIMDICDEHGTDGDYNAIRMVAARALAH